MSLPLLPETAFKPIADILVGKCVYYVGDRGTPGDQLIHAGAKCLFKRFGIQCVDNPDLAEIAVWGGGGNLGSLYKDCQKKRKELYAMGLPCVIMPQSADRYEEVPNGTTIFLRERHSLAYYPEGILAPDTALAFDLDIDRFRRVPELGCGVFLRQDKEKAFHGLDFCSRGDVFQLCPTYWDYFELISRFQCVVTDRLHLAICSLMLERETVLLPNSYHKNWAMYDTWLKDLGCLWGAEHVKVKLW